MKVGDYIRTKNDGIKKITKIDDFYYENYEDDFGHFYREKVNKKLVHYTIKEGEGFFQGGSALEEDIIKSNPDIKKVIEVGDYVNGYKVVSINTEYGPYGVYIEIPFVDSESIGCNEDLIEAKDIKSIVTKEQFASMEYRIGE